MPMRSKTRIMALGEAIRQAVQAGGEQAAAALVEHRAGAGDVEALMMLGMWRLWGLYGARNHRAAHEAFTRAADDLPEAAAVLAALLATGTGTPRDVAAAEALVRREAVRSPLAARQTALLDAMHQDLPPRRALRADPLVARIDRLLSAAECGWLIERATPLVRPSLVIDPRSGRRVPNPVRDSHGGNFAPPDEDVVIHAINRRIAAATGTAWEQGEPLHVLRYAPGQQYRRHLDALPGAANQRILTVLVYLNDDYDGGATAFTGGLEVRGQAGDAVIFANTDANGRADSRTEHAGLPVTRGIKWLATRWIRAAPFDPWAG